MLYADTTNELRMILNREMWAEQVPLKVSEKTMTRCECEEITFREVAEVARQHATPLDFDELRNEAGCGRLCTACHCDLKKYLAARKIPVPEPIEGELVGLEADQAA